ncbi:MAG: iron-sulfur-binding reductase, partial [Calditrichaeota bacterium]|nr:iron-sulfur-binding reductase [Calditrichota bacterium]
MLPSREVFWNISFHNLLYPLALIAIVLFIYGFYRRAKLWAAGQPHEITGSAGQRLKLLLTYGIAQGRVLKEIYPGLMHLLMYLGFVLLFIGTLVVSFDYDVWGLIFGWGSFLTGNFYLIFSLILDIAGGAAILGVLIALFRRYVQRPARLNNTADNLLSLIWLLIILISGFFVEGSRLAA